MAFKLLDAAAATGTSDSITLRKIPSKYSMQLIVTGSPTTLVVDLEGSLNGTDFIAVVQSTATASGSMTFNVDEPIRYVRANVTAISGGTTPTVTVLFEDSYS